MPVVQKVYENSNGGFYEQGKPFSLSKWTGIITLYEKEVEAHGNCTVCQLTVRASISKKSAQKAIDYYKSGVVAPVKKGPQTTWSGVPIRLGNEASCFHLQFICQ